MKKLLQILLFLPLFMVSQNDCSNAVAICSGTTFNPNGYGNQDLNSSNSGCLVSEHHSIWFIVEIASGGTLGATFNPNNNSNDLDFAVWKWNGGNLCPTTQPIRSSFCLTNGNVGLASSSTDVCESSNNGDGWVSSINASGGDYYLFLVDNYTSNGKFSVTFTGTATLNCSLLPIELLYFNCNSDLNKIDLSWETASEKDNKEFRVYGSSDAHNWIQLGTIPAAKNAEFGVKYQFTTIAAIFASYNEVLYFKLVQADNSNKTTEFPIVYCEYPDKSLDDSVKVIYYNVLGQEVNIETSPKNQLYIKTFIDSKTNTILKSQVVYH